MAEAAYLAAERLGRLAAEGDGYGVPEHKKLKMNSAPTCLGEHQGCKDSRGNPSRC